MATHLPWNLRDPESGAPEQIVPMIGSAHFFPKSAAAARALGDPRRPLEERYGSRESYLAEVREAAAQLVRDRYLLGEDLAVVEADAGERYDHATT